jgi:phosphoribosyl-AMP cyclohydrolase
VPEGVPLTVDDDAGALVDFAKDADGLVPAIVQDATDGTVLTVAYMDAEALRRTLETGRSWFYSRSRQEYWQKGETSGDRQYVREVRMDCDGDALVVLVDQHGRGACHTGERTCFYRTSGRARGPRRDPGGGPGPTCWLPPRPGRVRRPGQGARHRPGLVRGGGRHPDAGRLLRQRGGGRGGLPVRVRRGRRALGPLLVRRPPTAGHADGAGARSPRPGAWASGRRTTGSWPPSRTL